MPSSVFRIFVKYIPEHKQNRYKLINMKIGETKGPVLLKWNEMGKAYQRRAHTVG